MQHYRVWYLRDQHRQLDQQIRTELRRPYPDAMRLQALRRRRLHVKDAIEKAEAGLLPVRTGGGLSPA
ncbi:MAG: DUF465 domain-containing protein [Phenylobacterium sp.]|uniref:DUF465 domain-containing protein n=1 Tax=Phenylobacterium sp. TaxID=1871053 RepID=UPI001A41E955|nr:DUF465 domain-containing protein [Phenylobacterium sp.]MBL8554780.1 DUF465 domain-containing protein [Phenylobacterium sp.]